MCRRPEELCSVDRLYNCRWPLAHLCVVCCILFAKIMNPVLIDFDGTRMHVCMHSHRSLCAVVLVSDGMYDVR